MKSGGPPPSCHSLFSMGGKETGSDEHRITYGYEDDVTERLGRQLVAQQRRRLGEVIRNNRRERDDLGREIKMECTERGHVKGEAIEFCNLFNRPDLVIALANLWVDEIEERLGENVRGGGRVVLVAGSRYGLPLAAAMSLCAMSRAPDAVGPLPVFVSSQSGSFIRHLDDFTDENSGLSVVYVDPVVRSGIALRNVAESVHGSQKRKVVMALSVFTALEPSAACVIKGLEIKNGCFRLDALCPLW